MAKEDMAAYLANLALKAQFAQRGLDLQEVFDFTPLDLDLENRRLQYLLDFVEDYECCGSRAVMESGGFRFPPIYPGIEPDSDWDRFERWMRGEPVWVLVKDGLPPDLKLPPAEELTEEEIVVRLARLTEELVKQNTSIDLVEGLPPRLVYLLVVDMLKDTFHFFGDGFIGLDGCSGYCPGCMQRPWCNSGQDICWSEDKEAGKMHLTDGLEDYVSASPVSLALLQASQAERDRQMAEFLKNYEDLPGLPDGDEVPVEWN